MKCLLVAVMSMNFMAYNVLQQLKLRVEYSYYFDLGGLTFFLYVELSNPHSIAHYYKKKITTSPKGYRYTIYCIMGEIYKVVSRSRITYISYSLLSSCLPTLGRMQQQQLISFAVDSSGIDLLQC